jgi:hypothetical protein
VDAQNLEIPDATVNRTLIVVGYGSLLSGLGLLAERRGGGSRLNARGAFPVVLRNARRGLAKPSSHGDYLAMDLEPIDHSRPIWAHRANGCSSRGGIGALGLEFDIAAAPLIARREEYDPARFVELIALAERAGQPVGAFLFRIAQNCGFNLLDYRRALKELLGYTSPGYIFHPLPLDDGRVALVAIGAGFEGTGDPAVRSRRNECGMDRLLTLDEALEVKCIELDRAGQLGYFVECVLGGLHGLGVGDLLAGIDLESPTGRELVRMFSAASMDERSRFMMATSLSEEEYRRRFVARPDLSVAPLAAAVD